MVVVVVVVMMMMIMMMMMMTMKDYASISGASSSAVLQI